MADETEIPETGDGSGKHAPDFKNELFEGGRGLLVRAERAGTGNGRFYLFVVTASDGNNESVSVCVAAVTPHDSTAESLADVLAEASAAAAQVQANLDADLPLPPAGLFQHGVSSELGPKQ